MLKRIQIKGYKSLDGVEASFPPMAVLFGPNDAGKSNLLDALQLLSRLGTRRTLAEAFDPPCRGAPIESFTFGSGGLKELVASERLSFQIEADLHLSDTVVDSVNREIWETNQPVGIAAQWTPDSRAGGVHERDLRYRLEIEMLPRSGSLRVSDEYLGALRAGGEPNLERDAFVERRDAAIHVRPDGEARLRQYARHLDRTILSMPCCPSQFPHLAAVRRELEEWTFFYFEPRQKMRNTNFVKEVWRIGPGGEELAAYFRTLKESKPQRFAIFEKSLNLVMPEVEAIEPIANELGEVEIGLRKNGVRIPSQLLSEGTLRLLGLLAVRTAYEPPSLVCVEEPENGIYATRLPIIADLLKAPTYNGQTQFIVTTHSPYFADQFEDDSLFAVRQSGTQTCIDPLAALDPLGRRRQFDREVYLPEDWQPISERILRGDFGV